MPTWFARRVLDLVGSLADVYYRHKYGALARRLGRDAVSAADRPGFILLQIDGLSHNHLMRALDNGIMPYFKRLVDSGQLTIAPWRCGLPSSTPAVQAGVMFGNRFDIPGYRWYEKDRGVTVTPQRLDQISAVRDRISKGRQGILSGGSCYVSMFDGDAELALFTLSTLGRQRFFESLRGVGLLVLFMLSPFRVLRVLGLTMADYATRLARQGLALIKPALSRPRCRPNRSVSPRSAMSSSLSQLDILSPLLYAASDAFLTEVQTFGVMLDIYRRVPAIYANYNGYDEVAHELGSDHPAAFRVLRGVDRRIHQIDRMRSHYKKREYDLYLMADHGNTSSAPFSWQTGRTLGHHIVAVIDEGLSLDERVAEHSHGRDRARYLREELRALEAGTAPRLRSAIAAARRYVDSHVNVVDGADGDPGDDEGHHWDYDLQRGKDVIVAVSGSLAHIYLNISQRPLDLVEVLILYPQLVSLLTSTPGIGVLVGRAGERTVVLGKEGGTLEIGNGSHLVEPPHPLASFDDVDYAARQVHALAHFPHAGDVIVLGAMHENGIVTTFESQVATHGGLGGEQGRPFIAWPSTQSLDPALLDDPEDLYPYFMRYQDGAGSS